MPLFQQAPPGANDARTSAPVPRAASTPATDIDTRRDAARSIDAHLQRLQAAVLRFLDERGARGATDCEIRESLRLAGDTARARRCELRDAGLILDSGRRRPTRSGRKAVVWVSAATGALARRDEHVVEPPAQPPASSDDPGELAGESIQAPAWSCPRCGSSGWVDVPIHDSRSLRRDCSRCGRVVGFAVWHGRRLDPFPRPTNDQENTSD